MKVINSYHIVLPTPAWSKGTKGGLLAVLTSGDMPSGDMAAYLGLMDLDSGASDYDAKREKAANWIAHNGHKLSYTKALAYFPSLSESDYRA